MSSDRYAAPATEGSVYDAPRMLPREQRDKAELGGPPSSTFWDFADFDNWQGVHTVNVPFKGSVIVNAQSQIVGSITELNAGGTPFIGSATVQVFNIVPLDDSTAWVRAQVAWDHPLKVRLNFIIAN